MSNLLEDRLTQFRLRVRRLLWVYGLSWLVAVVVGGALLAGVIDWLIHLDDPMPRLFILIGIVVGGTWAGRRFLMAPLAQPLTDIDLAMRIEGRFPELKDSLASTIQFSQQRTDPQCGSPELQSHLIRETNRRVARLEFDDVIEPRSVRGVALFAAGVLATVALVAGFHRAEAATALNRLVFPFSAPDWPRNTVLQLVDANGVPVAGNDDHPLRIAQGDTLELFVANQKGELPSDARMQYRFGGESVFTKSLRTTTVPGVNQVPQAVGVDRLLVTRGPLEARAVGGDDDRMPWFRWQVVPPPVVEQLQLTLTPPAYSGKPTEQPAEGIGHVEGLVGTRIDIRARVNKALQSALLRIEENEPTPIELSSDERELNVSFVIERPGTYGYAFELTDLEGFRDSQAAQYEIRGVADLVPVISIDRPASDVYVTATAVVPFRIVAKDDLALSEIRLRYKQDEDSEDPGVAHVLHRETEGSTHREVEHLWDLSQLSLEPGTRFVIHAEATDKYDLGPEHVGRSLSRTLTVVTTEEKSAELAARQGGLLEELKRARKMQAETHDQVGELQIQSDDVGRLQQKDVDLLKRVELEQRQISSRLVGPVEGVQAQTEELLADLKANQIDDEQTRQRLMQQSEELSILRDSVLPAIERKLAQFRKAAQQSSAYRSGPQHTDLPQADPRNPSNQKQRNPSEYSDAPMAQSDPSQDKVFPPSSDVEAERRADAQLPDDAQQHSEQLSSIRDDQRTVLESLDLMLEQMSQWHHQQDIAGNLNDLMTDQEALNRETAEKGAETLAKSLSDLTPQQQADLNKLAARQRKQADRMDELAAKLAESATSHSEENPSAADTLLEANDHLSQRATAGQMREAAGHLSQNQVGQTATQQQQILEDLNELQNILRNPGVADREMLVKKLKEAETELDDLRMQQQELMRKTEQARELADPQQRELELQRLAQQQDQLRQQAEGMARRLRRLEARCASRSANRAASRMRDAMQQAADGDEGQAAQQQQEALDDIEQAQRELARARREAEEQLAREMLERVADELEGMVLRQQSIIDETQRLDDAHAARGNWSRGQLKSLKALADDQQLLRDETNEMVESLKAAEVIAMAMRGAAVRMGRAVDRLTDRKTDSSTIAVETAAKQRFLDVAAALKNDEESADQQSPSPDGPGTGGNGSGPSGDRIPQLAQLKMLKTLQQDLMQRTDELNQLVRESAELSEAQQAKLDALAVEQGELADLARNLTAVFDEAADESEEVDESSEELDLEGST